MKKLIRKLFGKKKKGIWDVKVKFIVDDSLERVKPRLRVLKKLEEANMNLSKIKSLPKSYTDLLNEKESKK